MTSSRLEYRVGLVVFISLVLFAYMIIKLSHTTFLHKTYEITAVFSETNGVAIGAPVWSCGVEIGKVKNIKLVSQPIPQVHLLLSIGQDIILRSDMKLIITSLGIMGEKVVEFQPTTNTGTPLQDGDVLEGIAPVALSTLLEESRYILQRINTLLEGLSDPAAIQNFKDALHNLKQLTVNFDTTISTFQDILTENRHNIKEFIAEAKNDAHKASKIIDTIGTISEKINMAQGSLGKLVNESALYDEMLGLITGLREKGIFYKKSPQKKEQKANKGFIS